MDNRKGMHMTQLGIGADTLCIIDRRKSSNGKHVYVSINGKIVAAHRYAWEQANGPIPESMFVCHRCDNPPCINVDHLFLGTPKDNTRDMALKGRDSNSKKTHCPRGHPYDRLEKKLSFSGFQRRCSICKSAYDRLRHAKRKAARGI